MFHKISLETCCCDTDIVTPPSGTLGTAVLTITKQIDAVTVPTCESLLGGLDVNAIQLQWQLFHSGVGTLHGHPYTNEDIRSIISGEMALIPFGGGVCSGSTDFLDIDNSLDMSVGLSANTAPGGVPPYHWRVSLGIRAMFSPPGFEQRQFFVFTSTPQQDLLDPRVATALTYDAAQSGPFTGTPLPLPPQETVEEPMFHTGLSFVAVTGFQ